MVVREYRPEDREQWDELYRRDGQKRVEPDNYLHVVKMVVEDEGRIVAALTCRVTCEAMLVIDHEAASAFRMLNGLKRMWYATKKAVAAKGIQEIHAPVAPWFPRFAEGLAKNGEFIRDPRPWLICDLRKQA